MFRFILFFFAAARHRATTLLIFPDVATGGVCAKKKLVCDTFFGDA
jgi:hypothetical protein